MRGWVLVPAWLGLVACGGAPTHVVRGEPFSTGNSSFDDFFTAVREVRTEALSAPDDAASARADLLKTMGLEAKSSAAQAVEEAGSRAKKLKDKGVLLHLEIAPEPKLLSVRGKVDLGTDGEGLLKSMEGAARSSLEMRKRLAAVAARAADLEKRRAELRGQAGDTFKQDPQSKRDEILAELDAAKGVLADAGDGAGRAAGAASRFVVELVQAVETGGAAVVEPGKPGKGKKGGPVIAAGPKGAAPPRPAGPAAAAAAPPPPPPKKKGKGGDDFEP